jgi:undecaprenyl-diphosphatase
VTGLFPPPARTRRSSIILSAVGVAGAAVLAVMWLLVARDDVNGIDRTGFTVLAARPGDELATHSQLIAVAAGILALLASILVVAELLRRRRLAEAAAIVAGYVLVLLLAHLFKAIQQRPRPSGRLITAGGFSFPSSDGAVSVGVVAIAVAAAALSQRRSVKIVIVVGALAATAVTGALLVALRTHYVSDVLAGWGLGAAVFSGCALAAAAIARRLDH